MGINIEPTVFDTNRRRNQRLPEAFKRSVVEQSYLPNTSVARLARSHGINANQTFAWRKLFRDAELRSLEDHDVALITVTLPSSTIWLHVPPGTGRRVLLVGFAGPGRSCSCDYACWTKAIVLGELQVCIRAYADT